MQIPSDRKQRVSPHNRSATATTTRKMVRFLLMVCFTTIVQLHNSALLTEGEERDDFKDEAIEPLTHTSHSHRLVEELDVKSSPTAVDETEVVKPAAAASLQLQQPADSKVSTPAALSPSKAQPQGKQAIV